MRKHKDDLVASPDFLLQDALLLHRQGALGEAALLMQRQRLLQRGCDLLRRKARH